MKKMFKSLVLGCCLLAATAVQANASGTTAHKPSPDATVKMLQEGNARFVANKSIHPHSDTNRLTLVFLAGQRQPGCIAVGMGRSLGYKSLVSLFKDFDHLVGPWFC